MDEQVKQKEYHWTEMWYNMDLQDSDEIEIADIYDDMQWWYEYQLSDWQQSISLMDDEQC